MSNTSHNLFWRHAFNAGPSTKEINNKPSMTIPGQSRTIPELLKRIGQGYVLRPSDLQEYSNLDYPLPDFSDLTDIDVAKNYLHEIEERAERRKRSAQKSENEGSGEKTE